MTTKLDPQTATSDELDRWLARNVMLWKYHGIGGEESWYDSADFRCFDHTWRPTSNRNTLADVLAKVPEKLRERVCQRIDDAYMDRNCEDDWYWFLLTADPLAVCRAVVAAYQQQESEGGE